MNDSITDKTESLKCELCLIWQKFDILSISRYFQAYESHLSPMSSTEGVDGSPDTAKNRSLLVVILQMSYRSMRASNILYSELRKITICGEYKNNKIEMHISSGSGSGSELGSAIG